MIKIIIRNNADQIVEIGEHHLGAELSIDRIIEEGCNILVITEMILEEKILRKCQIIEVKILEVNVEVTLEMITLEEIEVMSRERQYSGTFRRNDRWCSSRSRSGSKDSINNDRNRHFKCRKYDHFANDCLNP